MPQRHWDAGSEARRDTYRLEDVLDTGEDDEASLAHVLEALGVLDDKALKLLGLLRALLLTLDAAPVLHVVLRAHAVGV